MCGGGGARAKVWLTKVKLETKDKSQELMTALMKVRRHCLIRLKQSIGVEDATACVPPRRIEGLCVIGWIHEELAAVRSSSTLQMRLLHKSRFIHHLTHLLHYEKKKLNICQRRPEGHRLTLCHTLTHHYTHTHMRTHKILHCCL